MHVQPILSHLFRAFNLKLGPPNRTWHDHSPHNPFKTNFNVSILRFWPLEPPPAQTNRKVSWHSCIDGDSNGNFYQGLHTNFTGTRDGFGHNSKSGLKILSDKKKKTWFDFGNKHPGYMSSWCIYVQMYPKKQTSTVAVAKHATPMDHMRMFFLKQVNLT